jgi:hypothetical protein
VHEGVACAKEQVCLFVQFVPQLEAELRFVSQPSFTAFEQLAKPELQALVSHFPPTQLAVPLAAEHETVLPQSVPHVEGEFRFVSHPSFAVFEQLA